MNRHLSRTGRLNVRAATRRRFLSSGLALSPLLLGTRAGGLFSQFSTPRQAATATRLTDPVCIDTPQQTEGPYYVEEALVRSDVRSDPTTGAVSAGVPLQLQLLISLAGESGCTPISGAAVDIWQCNALGVYSDVSDAAQGFNTVGQKFLRGTQLTDAGGAVQFVTIIPGWYQGRTVHTHFKVRTDPGSAQGYEFTSQLYYDDAFIDQIHAQQPYAAKGMRDTRNTNDGIYQDGGAQLTLSLQPGSDGSSYSASMHVGVDLSVPESPAGAAGPPGGPGGPPAR